MDKTVVDKAQKFATAKLNSSLPDHARYHDLEHTQTVVSEVRELATSEKLDEDTIACLEVAAWFHDLGYIDRVEGHEKLSAKMADDFLIENKVNHKDRDTVRRVIMATEIEYEPQDLLEKLIKDADLSHLGMDNAKKRSELLRQEKENLVDRPIKESAWLKMNIDFLNETDYYTEAGQNRYGEDKKKYLKKLKKKHKKMLKKKSKKKKRGRGVETLFRVTLKNHTSLSQIADNKANIMLSINAIIISIVLTSLMPKLDNNTYLVWPSVILLAVCILAVIFATISTIPKVTRNGANEQKVRNRDINLLFFGNFQELDLNLYTEGMRDVMDDDDYLYDSLIRDLYYLGKVLDKKYKYLRLCYSVFMVGIIISVIAFVISIYFMFQTGA